MINTNCLLSTSINADVIEESLILAPRHERMLFSNRDKFDLVAVYDEASQSAGESPALKALMRAIYELAFRKILKNIPMILVGGLRCWKEKFPDDVVRGSTVENSGTSVGTSQTSGLGINGIASPLLNGTLPLSPLPSSPPLNSTIISNHSRVPAEYHTPPLPHHVASPPLGDQAHFIRSSSGGPTSEPGEYKVWMPPPGAGTTAPPDVPPVLRCVCIHAYVRN